MLRYSAGELSGTPSANNEVVAALWNASTSKQLIVYRVAVERPSTTVPIFQIVRTSTKGTPATTITPDSDNHFDRGLAPPSAAVLDLADFSVSPTTQGPPFSRIQGTASGGGIDLRLPSITVPQNTGIAVGFVGTGTAVALNVTFWWEE